MTLQPAVTCVKMSKNNKERLYILYQSCKSTYIGMACKYIGGMPFFFFFFFSRFVIGYSCFCASVPYM